VINRHQTLDVEIPPHSLCLSFDGFINEICKSIACLIVLIAESLQIFLACLREVCWVQDLAVQADVLLIIMQ
jgi:hypothetical protein